MDNISEGREKLQKALLEVSQNYLKNLELAPEESVSFSPKLKRKMKRLVKSQQKSRWKWVNTPLKRVIAACLAVLILSGVLISCTPIREPIVEFFTEVYEKFTEFFFGEENKDAALGFITEIHTLSYVPDGYELVKSSVLSGDKERHTVWKNSEDKEIMFYQSLLINKITVDSENAENKVLSNGLQIAMIQKEDVNYVFWNDEEYAYTLIVSNLSEEEIIKMIDSFI